MSLQDSGEDIHAIMARAKAARARLRNLAPQPQRVVNVEAAPIIPNPAPFIPPSWATFQINVTWGKCNTANILRDTDLLSISEIKEICCRYLGISPRDMTSHRRTIAFARPRQIAFYLVKEFTGRPLTVIGREFGGRDHTTIMHGIRKIEALMPVNPAIRAQVEWLRELLKAEESKIVEWKASRIPTFEIAA